MGFKRKKRKPTQAPTLQNFTDSVTSSSLQPFAVPSFFYSFPPPQMSSENSTETNLHGDEHSFSYTRLQPAEDFSPLRLPQLMPECQHHCVNHVGPRPWPLGPGYILEPAFPLHISPGSDALNGCRCLGLCSLNTPRSPLLLPWPGPSLPILRPLLPPSSTGLRRPLQPEEIPPLLDSPNTH